MAGRLVLVVGPSGAGKDTLIAAARETLSRDDRFVFIRRVVTRSAGAAEDHDSVSEQEFAAREQAGGFALSWRAHGLAYGVPARAADELDAGHLVIVNVSRTVIDAACAKFPGTAVVVVEAKEQVRARRLAARGRESPSEIEARLRRDAPLLSEGTIRIDNSGELEEGTSRFVAALRQLASV
jgi:ribose 1,5-bisphosphokinase